MDAYEGPRNARIMKRRPFGTLVPLLIGAVSAASLQTCTGWWLNSGTGVACTFAVLFLLALCVGLWSPRSPWARATATWAGACDRPGRQSVLDRARHDLAHRLDSIERPQRECCLGGDQRGPAALVQLTRVDLWTFGRSVRDRGVRGSNPLAPTNSSKTIREIDRSWSAVTGHDRACLGANGYPVVTLNFAALAES